ncbi:hypothetical protein IP90_00264 [Luteimonas cucumeris]|uniref:Uncharacterized protein n=1 Tax=Luteimonas cucumeris TaxID=985012 RepID=A0A562LE94_9GAMM|nr:hypothetical protein IP90_00264 [Luteimonas cucumeris]
MLGMTAERETCFRHVPAIAGKPDQKRALIPAALTTPPIRLAPDTIIVAVQVRPITGISTVHRCCTRGARFRAVGEHFRRRGIARRRHPRRCRTVGRRVAGARCRRGTGAPVAVVFAGFAIGVATMLVEPAAMRAGDVAGSQRENDEQRNRTDRSHTAPCCVPGVEQASTRYRGSYGAGRGGDNRREQLQGSTTRQKAPADGFEVSSSTQKAPALGLRGPTAARKVPTAGLFASTTTQKAPSEVLSGFKDGKKAPIAALQAPALAKKAPREALSRLEDGQKAPTASLKGPTPAQKASNEALQASTDRQKAPPSPPKPLRDPRRAPRSDQPASSDPTGSSRNAPGLLEPRAGLDSSTSVISSAARNLLLLSRSR